MTRDARAIVTIPVPRLMSQVLLYCAMRHPARPVMALATQRPTVIVNAGLIEDARTIAGLSPVARIERPRVVLRNQRIRRQTTRTTAARRISLLQLAKTWLLLSFPKSVKIVSVPKMETFELKPMTARFTV